MSAYFKDLSEGITTTLKGMSVTLKHLFSKPVTVQYPNKEDPSKNIPIADAYRGIHELAQEGCRACNLCVKACPVECIDIDSDRHMKRVVELKVFTIDYNKCIFCGLCTEACPTDVLKMTKAYDLSTDNRNSLVRSILEWVGLRDEDRENIRKLEEQEKRKAEEAVREQTLEKEKKAAEAESGEAGDADASSTGKASKKKAVKKAAKKKKDAGGDPPEEKKKPDQEEK